MTRTAPDPHQSNAKRRSARATASEPLKPRERRLHCDDVQQRPGVSLSAGPLRALSKTHGGKWYLLRVILPLIRASKGETTLDLFGGGGVITLNAPSSKRIYADAEWFKANFLTCVRDHPLELQKQLSEVKYSEEAFAYSKQLNQYHRDRSPLADRTRTKSNRLICATHWLIRNRMSRGGLGNDFAWSDRLRGGRPGDLNAWMNCIAAIPRVSARLQGVEINCRTFKDSLKWMPSGRVCIYADPPYLHATRVTTSAYEIEMTDAEHLELLAALTIKAGEGHHVIISGYANDLYKSVLRGWRCKKISMPNHSGQGKTKQRRVEVIWQSPIGGAKR